MKNYTRDGGAEFMLNSKIWIMLGELVVLAIAAAGEIAAALSNTNRSNRKQLTITVAIIATVVAGVMILYQISDELSAFSLTTTPALLPSMNIMTAAPSVFAFNFENGTQHWGTSEGNFKLAKVGVTTRPVHSGRYALQITTALLGNANPLYNGLKEVYRHTEATVYFDQVPPNGFSVPGPYNLSGKRVSCFVFLPSRLATEDNHQTYIRIFVKDTKFANDFSTAVNIDPSVTNRWIQLSFIVGAESGNADRSFDPTRVNAIGIRIETPDGSTMSYNGTFYIDDCSI